MYRLQKLRQTIKNSNIDGVLITNPQNRRYLSGFSGSAGVLLIGLTEAIIITDFRYWEQVGQEADDEFSLHRQEQNLWQSIREVILRLNWRKIGFEAGSVTFNEYELLKSISAQLELFPLKDPVEQQRWVKERTEVELIAGAVRITDLAWEKTIAAIKPGVREREIALEFDYQLRLNGAEGSAFPTIVASGVRGALPNPSPSEKKVAPGELIIIDGGAVYKGYYADMTRTVVLGKADSKQREIYQIVLEAQAKALESMKAGLTGKMIDAIAREFIADKGYGEYFGHGLGHSLGLSIHESPRLSETESGEIPAGAVITVEPGIYLPGWGGVRIEDLVVVREDGIRDLTNSPKQELIEL